MLATRCRDRAPGGANFWAPTSGKVFGFETVQAARGGHLGAAAGLVAERAARNLRELVSSATAPVEKGILASYALLALGALAGRRRTGPLGRRMPPARDRPGLMLAAARRLRDRAVERVPLPDV
jgi:hypothetical protein